MIIRLLILNKFIVDVAAEDQLVVKNATEVEAYLVGSASIQD